MPIMGFVRGLDDRRQRRAKSDRVQLPFWRPRNPAHHVARLQTSLPVFGAGAGGQFDTAQAEWDPRPLWAWCWRRAAIRAR